ncbi:coatomer beta C-terminal region-domain-containing protein [Chytridium lagenaria]|nr:coatomer beta C-terminal region-domain-containing protein [Chytridium lagenaria]
MSEGLAYTLVLNDDEKDQPTNGKDEQKIDTMKKILLLMHNKALKKLLLFYWEIPCLAHDLQHPNEYIRGNTLRLSANFESDANSKRNAFVMLINTKPALAAQYLSSIIGQLQNLDEVIQLAIIEFVRKDCRNPQAISGKYPGNSYSNSTAVKAAASCYIELIIKEADTTLSLLCWTALMRLEKKMIESLTTCNGLLRVLSSPDIDVRRKVLKIAMQMCSSRNIDEVVSFLKKDLLKTLDQDYEKNLEYRQLLINSIHSCAIKEVMEKFPKLRPSIMEKLLESFADMRTGRVFRGALWIIAIETAFSKIKESLGEIPILASEQRLLEEDDSEKPEEEKRLGRPSPLEVNVGCPEASSSSLILNGDYFVSSSLASALTKLVLRYSELCSVAAKVNEKKRYRVGKSEFPTSQMDEDTYDRISNCLKDTRKAFTQLTAANDKKIADLKVKDKKVLKSKKGGIDLVDEYALDLNKATGNNDKTTGFSDPVYAEAYVNVNQYDILMVSLYPHRQSNKRNDANLTVEFSTLGDLKLVERPTPQTIGPRGFHSIRANVKVSSTETGVIFGNIVYDGPSVVDVNCVIMNDIHMISWTTLSPHLAQRLRYLHTQLEYSLIYRSYSGFSNYSISDLMAYLNHVMKMWFLAANLYARSIFGEDALANICLEKQGSSITGHIRIRSKTQGIALSLGDKITFSQKSAVVV